MKVLKLCLVNPWAVGNGISKLIVNRTVELEKKDHSVDILYFKIVAGSKRELKTRHRASGGRDICLEVGILQVAQVACKRILFLLGRVPIQCIMSYIYEYVFGKHIKSISEKYEVCHFYHIRTLGLWRCVSQRPAIVIDLIDSYTLNYRNRLASTSCMLIKYLIRLELARIEKVERNIERWTTGREKEVVLTVAAKDSGYVSSSGIAKAIVPVGIDLPNRQERSSPREFNGKIEVVFFGNLNYEPNVTACKLLAEVASLTRDRCISYRVGGRNASLELVRRLKAEKIKVVSPVEDMKTFVSQADIAVLPMVSGSGMQSKILEAIAWNCLVVATQRVALPLSLEEGQQYIRAEDSREFAKSLIDILEGKFDIERIKAAATSRIAVFEWSRTVDTLLGVYRDMVDDEKD